MEIQLANKLGVSRTPIREAIRKLELEGLVLMIPRKGAEVAEITEKSLRDVLEVRRALEELAVELACEKITDVQIQELRDAAEEFRESLKEGDITRIAEADVKFPRCHLYGHRQSEADPAPQQSERADVPVQGGISETLGFPSAAH